ncbi:hypothetical protein T12_14149, partial [Trichinella patagoniensis]
MQICRKLEYIPIIGALYFHNLYKCYYDHEHCLEDISRNSSINIHQMEFYFALISTLVLFRLPLLLLKSHHPSTFFAISRQIRVHTPCDQFWKVLRQINPYVSNKWPLKLPCAYLNTQESRHSGTPLIWNKGDFFAIIMRYSLTFFTLVQYFLVLGNLIFLHFRTISNKLKKVVSLRFDMCIKSSIYLFLTDLSHLIDQM